MFWPQGRHQCFILSHLLYGFSYNFIIQQILAIRRYGFTQYIVYDIKKIKYRVSRLEQYYCPKIKSYCNTNLIKIRRLLYLFFSFFFGDRITFNDITSGFIFPTDQSAVSILIFYISKLSTCQELLSSW